jgi:hypothetical protein
MPSGSTSLVLSIVLAMLGVVLMALSNGFGIVFGIGGLLAVVGLVGLLRYIVRQQRP